MTPGLCNSVSYFTTSRGTTQGARLAEAGLLRLAFSAFSSLVVVKVLMRIYNNFVIMNIIIHVRVGSNSTSGLTGG